MYGSRLPLASLSTTRDRFAIILRVLQIHYGEVTEWFMVTVLKTVVGQLTASSNLALSAT